MQGSDVWLASSVIPEEASGTSGMKAMMNGTLILSTNDGFVRDGLEDEVTGFIYGGDLEPPKDETARKDYLAKEAAAFYAKAKRMIELYPGKDGGSDQWVRMMRASIYYGVKVFGMNGVELGRMVPPLGNQKGYFNLYAGAAADLAHELFVLRFKKREPSVRVMPGPDQEHVRASFTARIPAENMNPLIYDYYFWYGKKTDPHWVPVQAKVKVTGSILHLGAYVHLPKENSETDYGMTYFAVPKGTHVLGLGKDHWGLGKAIWRARIDQDIHFMVPPREPESVQGQSLGTSEVLDTIARDLRKPEQVKFEGMIAADAAKQQWVLDFLAGLPDGTAKKVSPFLHRPEGKPAFIHIHAIEKPAGLVAGWLAGKKAAVRMEIHEDRRSSIFKVSGCQGG